MHSNSSKKAKKATNRLPKSKKMLHSLTPKLTNATIRGAVRDYLKAEEKKMQLLFITVHIIIDISTLK